MAEQVIRVSSKVRPTRYIFDAKVVLCKHSQVELHAVGGSIVSALRTADRLIELGYASLARLQTERVEDARDDAARVASKLVVTLQKSDRFDVLDEEFEKQKAARSQL